MKVIKPLKDKDRNQSPFKLIRTPSPEVAINNGKRERKKQIRRSKNKKVTKLDELEDEAKQKFKYDW